MHHWDMNVQLDLAILDFSKAFDTVPHNRLLATSNLHTWLTSFLKNRSQCVAVDGAYSEEVHVDSGVPQGTVLGPILFLYNIL